MSTRLATTPTNQTAILHSGTSFGEGMCPTDYKGVEACAHDRNAAREVHKGVDAVYRAESRRIHATLIRLIGDFDLAEDALHDAFAAALERWPREGVPVNPRAWLVSAGRFKAIDALRRRTRFEAVQAALAERIHSTTGDPKAWGDKQVEDDRLRLIFTCCHSALPADASVALTLREVCGLTTEEIARAFFTSPATLGQRIVRAKAKIRGRYVPHEMPSRIDLQDRLDAVLRVVYLMFNEGYSASTRAPLTRPDPSAEAIRLGRLLLELLPEPEVMGLLALMLLQESTRLAGTTPTTDLVLLEDSDRSLWNQEQIAEGRALVKRALFSRRYGPYTIQAAIAAVHAEAHSNAAVDWARILTLYDLLAHQKPTPVVELNRAIAVAMRDGALAGLELVDRILGCRAFGNCHLAHVVRADLCRRLGRTTEARASYERALRLTRQEAERRFLESRLAELSRETKAAVMGSRGDEGWVG
jgi:RNA polymerase sigma-70 factor, ECF subfamily